MASFEAAIPFLFTHEGGYVDDPNDPGGETNYGISQRFLATIDYVNPDGKQVLNVRDLTRNDCIRIYKLYWWDDQRYGDFNNQLLATKMLDSAVNIGKHPCARILQKSCNKFLEPYDLLAVDGIIGDNTINKANSLNGYQIVVNIRDYLVDYYLDLIQQNPKLDIYRKGWLKRAIS